MKNAVKWIPAIGAVILVLIVTIWNIDTSEDRKALQPVETQAQEPRTYHIADSVREEVEHVKLSSPETEATPPETTTTEATESTETDVSYEAEEYWTEAETWQEVPTNQLYEDDETTTAEWTEPESAEEAAAISDWETTLLVYQVWGEIGICDGGADYYGMQLQTAVVLNRIRMGWGSSISEVIYAPGQFVTWWYEQLMSQGPHPSQSCWEAAYSVLEYNDTPAGLIYADSRQSIPAGCYLYYESPTGQRFYCLDGY